MARFAFGCVLIGVALFLGSALFQAAQAQDFPYMVPQAPEFDDRGNPVRSVEAEPAASNPSATRGQYPQAVEVRSAPEAPADYRSGRPFAPRSDPKASLEAPVPERSPGMKPLRSKRHTQRAAIASQGPGGVDNQNSQAGPEQDGSQGAVRMDCSRFPQVIAAAPSEGEMQLAAREYLTCLLRTGWNPEMARKQVISTIETAYRLAR